MKYGQFDDINKEYVINTPYTPYPWINYHGNESYFSLFSNTAGGYSFYKDARNRRITRYRYNNVPIDNEGKYFFIKDGDTIWNPGVKPTKTKTDSYECRHGLGYSVIKSSLRNLEAKQTSFVPLKKDCEIHRITLTNNSDKTKDISLYSYVEWNLWDAYDDMTNFQRNYNIGEVEVENNTIFHKTEYRERRNHFAFYNVNQDITGFDSDRESFIGLYNDIKEPLVVTNGKATNSIASGWSPIASHEVKVTLQPNETKNIIFTLGYIENKKEEKFTSHQVINKEKAYTLINEFQTNESVEQALQDLKEYWTKTLAPFQISSPDDKLNRMVNIWNAYQVMITFNLSRSASYFESGVGRGMGFRDSNQDMLGFVHQAPERAKERLIDLISTQLQSGTAYHQYSPLTKRGNGGIGSGFNDDPLWMVLSVCAYVKETGDFDFLQETAPYENNEDLQATILDHMKKAVEYTLNNLGPHGLPLIGRADWNDCLNLNCYSDAPGESFQTVENNADGLTAESIFISGLFSYAANDFIPLLDIIGDTYSKTLLDAKSRLEENTLKHGFDGEWFLRAYDANGNKVGSNECEEGKIFIEPQGMCVLGGIGVETGEANKALDSVKKYLDTDYGMVLNYPAYSKYYLELGEISSYPEGYKENGGIFCHNNPWVMMAFTTMRRKEDAFASYKKISPAYIEDISDIHRTEPYVYSQMIAGKEAVRHGEAKNSWLTGTAAYNYVAITQHILGVKADYLGLYVNPCLPKELPSLTITRIFRGVTYVIEVSNNNQDKCEIYINNKLVNDHIIPYNEQDKGQTITVSVSC